MSAFEYVSVFMSIILGLAVVHLLGGVSLILDQRVKAKNDWIHFAWVINLFSLITWVWWGNWQLNDLEVFSPLHYLAMVMFCVVLYLMCGLLFPVRGKEVDDFEEQFELNRKRFFYLGNILIVASAIKGYVDRYALEEPDTIERAIMLGLLIIAFFIGAKTSSRKYHAVLAVAFFALTIRWIVTE